MHLGQAHDCHVDAALGDGSRSSFRIAWQRAHWRIAFHAHVAGPAGGKTGA